MCFSSFYFACSTFICPPTKTKLPPSLLLDACMCAVCVCVCAHLAAFNKRSENAGQMSDGESEQLAMEQQLNSAAANDRLGDLLDLNSEPAVEDLMRQIMSQAKMWEAIQEANREMVYQKAQSNSKPRERFPMAFSAQ